MIFKIIDKYRKEAHEQFHGSYKLESSWRQAILEAIFRPTMKVPGKGPLTHLHPDLDKLHLPPGVLISDWRKYRVEDHPALVNFQKRCHASGLHDPWLRNYCGQLYPNTMYSRSRLRVITTGMLFGFCAASVLYVAERLYDMKFHTWHAKLAYYHSHEDEHHP